LDLQQELVEKYEQFVNENQKLYDGSKLYFTKDDVHDALDVIGDVEYIQYTQLTLQYEAIDDFKQLFTMAKKDRHLQAYLDSDTKTYLREFISSKANLKNNIKKLTYQKGMEELPKDQFKELVKRLTMENVAKVKKETRDDIRYPA